jgi:predicted ArsR family transcriptional regulator
MTSAGARSSAGAPGRRRDMVFAVVRASATPLSVETIADRLGVHVNTVRFHLDALVKAGRIERSPADSRREGRPPLVYRASRTMDRGGPSNYRLLATILTSHLAATTDDPATVATELGRAWGPSLADQPPRTVPLKPATAVTRLVRILDDLGFQPEPPAAGGADQVRLRHCPFLDLVDSHADVICPLHLGLMQGALAAMPASITVNRLEPFTEPDVCTAYLAHGKAAPGNVGSADIGPSADNPQLASGARRAGQPRSSSAAGATGRLR